METLISNKEAAKLLGIHPLTLRNWQNSGKIEAVRTAGGHYRYRLSDIVALQEQGFPAERAVTAIEETEKR